MMKNVLAYMLLGAVLLVGCGKNEVIEKPDNLIPKDKMENILYDIAILSSSRGYSATILEENGIAGEEMLYNKYGIDSLQLAQSNVYYSSKPEEFSKLFGKVQKRLEKYKAKLDIERQAKNKKAQDKSKADSVKTIDPKKLKQEMKKEPDGNKIKD